jgi:hypothetical protein
MLGASGFFGVGDDITVGLYLICLFATNIAPRNLYATVCKKRDPVR